MKLSLPLAISGMEYHCTFVSPPGLQSRYNLGLGKLFSLPVPFRVSLAEKLPMKRQDEVERKAKEWGEGPFLDWGACNEDTRRPSEVWGCHAHKSRWNGRRMKNALSLLLYIAEGKHLIFAEGGKRTEILQFNFMCPWNWLQEPKQEQ